MDNYNSYTRFPNSLLEAMLLHDFTASELVVMLYVARKTYGWGKQTDTISVRKLAADTGHDLRGMQRTVKKLQDKKVLSIQSRSSRGMPVIGINDPSLWAQEPKAGSAPTVSRPTVYRPYTVSRPTVRQSATYGQATVGSDGQATVGSYGQTTTHNIHKDNKYNNTKESAPPAPEGANVAADAADANASAADTANANADDWTPSELPDDIWADESLWK